jgi:U3 small nucleolar RNA-associated protein 18
MYSTEHTRASAAPKPLKALMNLTTRIDSLTFNHDAQLCAMASKRNKDAFRLVHVPSQTVFANWPTGQTPLSFVQCCAFTPSSGTELAIVFVMCFFFFFAASVLLLFFLSFTLEV